jgi:ElaB/YqjD/DUF883 family membrane-anchored ribosome-binding protein
METVMENGHEPATKADLEKLRSATKSDLEKLQSDLEKLQSDLEQFRSATKSDLEQIRSEFQHGFDELKETVRDGQTEILKAFYGYTQTTDAKLKEGEISDNFLRERLTIVESRLLNVERRLNMPPQTQ